MQFNNLYVTLVGRSKEGLLHTIFRGNIQLVCIYWTTVKQEVKQLELLQGEEWGVK